MIDMNIIIRCKEILFINSLAVIKFNQRMAYVNEIAATNLLYHVIALMLATKIFSINRFVSKQVKKFNSLLHN